MQNGRVVAVEDLSYLNELPLCDAERQRHGYLPRPCATMLMGRAADMLRADACSLSNKLYYLRNADFRDYDLLALDNPESLRNGIFGFRCARDKDALSWLRATVPPSLAWRRSVIQG